MERIIRLVLQSRLLMCVLGILVIGAGWYSYNRLPVDAFPDVTPALVQVFTETEGLAPEEVEKYVTYPVEVAMNGLPNLKEIRSVSNFGLSVVNIYFEDCTDIYFARQLVGERLQLAREEIPEGFGEPEMGPITTGLGQILFYVVEDETGRRTPEQMREIQDWLIKFNIQTVPGVTEVLSLGGEVKQFQVLIRPADLLRYDLTLEEVVETIRANNSNVGAQFLVKNSEEYIVRSVGLAEKLDDLEKIVLKVKDGTPVYLDQVADIVIGGEVRRGLATMDGKGEAIVGMVLKLIGTNTSQVISDVKAKIAKINKVLPEGIKIVPYYDQATLVAKCVNTVTKALLEAVVLIVFLLLYSSFNSLRNSLLIFLNIPLALVGGVIGLWLAGQNLSVPASVGFIALFGIALANGMVLVTYINQLLRNGVEVMRAAVEGACLRLRPVIMTATAAGLGLVPMALASGTGSKVQRPLATVVIGGLVTSTLLTLLVVPALYKWFAVKVEKEVP
ncbi:AcrB/AcrD/AcrF family protein [Geothermobacter ehrlichii]|uniref:AcrB/AcrD/AcrF family protein n=1 Tax=Geothermobacter ehrlichii TaxID=213224 RepID=A0A5D3WE68_9BACT|nr:efflux RND transporter permease subunit [Geothermobacter ehrlichii]TYO95017.1 AcrB/AcrD/AcrF family protein [Geothermobacter ehrlichii]